MKLIKATKMIGYFGHYRNTEIEVQILNQSDAAITGAGKIVCQECGGDGDWTKFHPVPELGPFQCVPCKGTGFVYISV
jgi:hypothetical protein